jgi:Protein of unknown function (DUF2630)
MEDTTIHSTIEKLVDEEHTLWEREAAGVAGDYERRRLRCRTQIRMRRRSDGPRSSSATSSSSSAVRLLIAQILPLRAFALGSKL